MVVQISLLIDIFYVIFDYCIFSSQHLLCCYYVVLTYLSLALLKKKDSVEEGGEWNEKVKKGVIKESLGPRSEREGRTRVRSAEQKADPQLTSSSHYDSCCLLFLDPPPQYYYYTPLLFSSIPYLTLQYQSLAMYTKSIFTCDGFLCFYHWILLIIVTKSSLIIRARQPLSSH